MNSSNRPSEAFILASWVALIVGMSSFLIGLWNNNMELNEKGYYLTLLIFGLFSAISLQKSIRDRAENIPLTSTYLTLCWFAFISSVSLLVIGLVNTTMLLNEKGFYAVSFFLSLYASISVQKNVRDMANFPIQEREEVVLEEDKQG